MLVPIHKIGKTEEDSHWYLAVIDIKGKDMHMCDSIGGGEQKVLVRIPHCTSLDVEVATNLNCLRLYVYPSPKSALLSKDPTPLL